MTVRRLAPLFISVSLISAGCSDQAGLENAKKRISQLESELAAEKAKKVAPVAVTAQAHPKIPPKASEPEPKVESTGSQWDYDEREDKMTGGTTRHASVISTNLVNFSSPYSGPQHGRLALRIDPKYGRDVIFRIERGQLLCRSYEDCEILIRFDQGKPERFSAAGPADNSTDTLFIRAYDRFLSKLRKAKTVRLSVNIYQEGAPVFEFDVSGFDVARFTGKKT